MTQLENLKNQIKELEKSCDEARDRIKNENLPFLNIYENRAGDRFKFCVNVKN